MITHGLAPCGECRAYVPAASGCRHWHPSHSGARSRGKRYEENKRYRAAARERAVTDVAAFREGR
jgi:hypothetical protein